jgi:hypothetical protein
MTATGGAGMSGTIHLRKYARTLPTPFAVRMADVHMTSIFTSG